MICPDPNLYKTLRCTLGHSTSLGFFPVWQLPSCNNIIIAAPIHEDVLTHGAGAGDGDFLRGRLTLRGRGGAGAGAGDLGRGAGAGICRGGDRDGLDLDILEVMTDQLI